MMNAEPHAMHRWLKQLIGDWTSDANCDAPPGESGAPAKEKSTGSEHVSDLGDLWVLCEGTCTMRGGGEAHMLMTLGYDPEKSVFRGTWVGSMMSHMFVYEGTLDADQKVLTLETEGPSFKDDGKPARSRDVITLWMIQRHAQNHPQRDQGEQPGVLRQGQQQGAEQHGNHGGEQGDLIGRHAFVVEAFYPRAQEVLKRRLELVNGEHGEEFLFAAWARRSSLAALPGAQTDKTVRKRPDLLVGSYLGGMGETYPPSPDIPFQALILVKSTACSA